MAFYTSYTTYPGLHGCQICSKLVIDCRPKVGYEDSMFSMYTSMGARNTKSNRWRPPPRLQQYLDRFAQASPNKKINIQNNSFIFDITGPELRNAAKLGCLFCEYAKQVFDGVDDGTFLAAHGSTDSAGPCYNFCTTIPPGTKLYGSSTGGMNVLWRSSRGDFRLVAPRESPVAQDVLARPLNNFPLSDSASRWAKGLLQTCIEKHPDCVKPNPKFSPTRLLQIIEGSGNSISLRLFETPRDSAPSYAALSYVWGGDQRVKTTKSTVERRRKSIEMLELPQSLQDAIRVSIALGLRLLWIDALCIVQDDDDDRGREIAMMTKIYSNATITLLASRAKDVEEGFLQERLEPGVAFELPYISSTGASGRVVLDPRIKVVTEPLDTRGWTLQERLLSIRTLEFGKLQTRWSCQGVGKTDYDNCVDGFVSKPFGNDEKSDELFLKILKKTSQMSPIDSPTEKSRKKVLEMWYELLYAYSHRRLTLESDRLLAVSGIARQFGAILQDVYLVGIWLSDIESGLLWASHNTPESRAITQKQQSPSWSWTSHSASVTFKYRHRNRPLFTLIDYNIEYALSAQLNTQDTEGRTTDTFGAVKSATLKIKAKLQQARWNGAAHDALKRPSSTGEHGIEIPSTVHQDITIPSKDGGIDVYLLILGTDVSDKKPDFVGLLLNDEGNGTYSRLGLFYHNHTAWVNATSELRRKGVEPDIQYEDSVQWLLQDEEQVITLV